MIMVLKLESKRCAEVGSTTYIEFSKLELLFPFTGTILMNCFQALPGKENEKMSY